MVKSDEQRASEIFELLEEKMITNFLTDDEIKYVHWLCSMNDEKWHAVLVGILDKMK